MGKGEGKVVGKVFGVRFLLHYWCLWQWKQSFKGLVKSKENCNLRVKEKIRPKGIVKIIVTLGGGKKGSLKENCKLIK